MLSKLQVLTFNKKPTRSFSVYAALPKHYLENVSTKILKFNTGYYNLTPKILKLVNKVEKIYHNNMIKCSGIL